jgi:hypothetical protein
MARLKDHLRKFRHNLPFFRSFYSLRLQTIALKQETIALKQETIALKQETIALKQEIIALEQETNALRQELEALKLIAFAVEGNCEANRRLEGRLELLETKLADQGRHD